MKWYPTIEPNKFHAAVKDAYGNVCEYVVRGGNDVAYPNRPYMGNEQLWLKDKAPYNEIARRRLPSAVNVESVVHEFGGRVIVWHYMDTGPLVRHWSMPNTNEVRRWVDSLGYKRAGKVTIESNGLVRLPRHEYVVAGGTYANTVEIKTMGEWK